MRTDSSSMAVNRVLTTAAFFISAVFLHLIAELLHKTKQIKKLIWANYLYSTIGSIITVSSRLLVNGSVPKLDMPAYLDAGPLYFLLPLQMFFCVTQSIIWLLQSIRKEKTVQRKTQLTIFLIATAISFATGMVAYLLTFDIPIKPFTTPFVGIYPLFMAYAIIKHRFLDIQKLIRNTLIFSLLFISLLSVVSFSLFIFQKILVKRAGLSESICQFIAILMALVLYSPLKKGLSIITRKLLYQHKQNPADMFRQLSQDLFRFADVKKLADEMISRVSSCLALENIIFFRRDRADESAFVLISGLYKAQPGAPKTGSALIRYLEHSGDVLLNPHRVAENKIRNKQKGMREDWKQVRQDALREMARRDRVVALPVFIGGKLDGIILIGNKKSDGAWTQEELGVLKSFTRCFSLALANADAAEHIRFLQRKISASERDASAGVLIAGVDHEAKNPLHAASLALGALEGYLTKEKFKALPREEQEKTVIETMQSVLEDVEEVNRIIQHLSDLAEQKPLQIQSGVSLKEILRKTLRTSAVPGDVAVSIEFPENFSLTCDPDALQEILVNLIRNAVQAAAQQIQIKASAEKGTVTIEVKDSGNGIPPAIQQKIFEPFFTTKERKSTGKPEGTGMGLFIVKEYMRAMGGEIKLLHDVKPGSVFHLVFSQFPNTLAEVA